MLVVELPKASASPRVVHSPTVAELERSLSFWSVPLNNMQKESVVLQRITEALFSRRVRLAEGRKEQRLFHYP